MTPERQHRSDDPPMPRPIVGEPFNPWRGSCGFYLPDVLSRLRGVTILETKHRLTDLHKGLFVKLVRRAGQNGQCYPSYQSLAEDLGRSLRQVKTAVADLEAFGLISHRRRGRGKGGRGLENEYRFLWHSIYEVQFSPRLRVLKCNSGAFDVQDSAVLKCNNHPPPYKEEAYSGEACTEGSSSSSRPASANRENQTQSTTTTLLVEITPKPKPEAWWTPAQLAKAQASLAKHRTCGYLPDSLITANVLGNLASPVEFDAWLWDLSRRFPGTKIRSWGFYENDARLLWPQRRVEIASELAAAKQDCDRRAAEEAAASRELALEAERRQELIEKCRARGWTRFAGVACRNCAGFGRDPDTESICSCLAGDEAVLELKRCPSCGHDGIVTKPDWLSEWCTCEHGRARQEREPDAVERVNAAVLKLRRMAAKTQAA